MTIKAAHTNKAQREFKFASDDPTLFAQLMLEMHRQGGFRILLSYDALAKLSPELKQALRQL